MNTNVSILLASNLAGQAGFDLTGVALALAPDGSRVAWEGFNSDFVPDDLNDAPDVFIMTPSASTIELASARHSDLWHTRIVRCQPLYDRTVPFG